MHLALKNNAGISKRLQYQSHLIHSSLLSSFTGIFSPFSHELKVEQSPAAEGEGVEAKILCPLSSEKCLLGVIWKLGYLSKAFQALPEGSGHWRFFSISVNPGIQVHRIFVQTVVETGSEITSDPVCKDLQELPIHLKKVIAEIPILKQQISKKKIR